jgi:hypothetical protein
MKKVRFFSVAVAVVAALFVSAWAGSTTFPITTLNIPSVPGQSNVVCRTCMGPSTSYMTNVNNIRGTISISSGCAAKYYLQLFYLNGSTQQLIKEIEVKVGSLSNSNYQIDFPPNTYRTNETYCIGFRATLVASTVPMCAATLSDGSFTCNWSP